MRGGLTKKDKKKIFDSFDEVTEKLFHCAFSTRLSPIRVSPLCRSILVETTSDEAG